LNIKQIKLRREEIAQQCGDWTAHNIHLRDDVYTYDQSHPQFHDQLIGHGTHLRRIMQIVSDMTDRPLSTLRVLDLACLEGLYGIEFARHGAQVIGIEGREANIRKALFAKDVLELDNLVLLQEDVRHLSAARHGHFDVVLCCGILYHLDAPDVFQVMARISEVCLRVTVIDTHVSLAPNTIHVYQGKEYRGRSVVEHAPDTPAEEKLKAPWASLDNECSFWLTRPSLFNLLAESGFTSVYTCENPVLQGQRVDRDTLVAMKGRRQELLSTPTLNSMPEQRWPEASPVDPYPSQQQLVGSRLSRITAFSSRVLFKGQSVIKRTLR